MKLKSFFQKRPYQYLWAKYFPFYIRARIQKTPTSKCFIDIIKNLNQLNFDRLVVVASGPSARNVKLSDNCLYLCTNNSIDIVKKQKFIYFIQDKYIVLRYLKFFKPNAQWQGTFCLVNNNDFEGNKKVYEYVSKYLKKYSRSKGEYLISDFNKTSLANTWFEELNSFLEKEFDYKFESLNSGFSLLILSVYIAFILDKPLEVYGLDFGYGGKEYFDGKQINEKHCAYEKKNIIKMDKFIDRLYKNKKIKVKNYSFYRPN